MTIVLVWHARDMDVFEAMRTCRAMRYFTAEPVGDDLIERVVTAATWAPSPGNSQGRDFVVVTDHEKKRVIGEAIERVMADRVDAMDRPDRMHRLMLDGTSHLVRSLHVCPVLIFVCGKAVYPDEAPRESFVWSSIYPAAQNLIVAARALGLGTAFTTFQGVAEPVVRATLDIPDDVYIGCMIPLGWPAREFGPVNRVPYAQVVHRDTWQGDLRATSPITPSDEM